MTMKFDAWMKRVDTAVIRKVGLSVHDLPDVAFRDMYADGMTPTEVARIAMEEI